MPILWTSPFNLYCLARAIHPSSLPFLSTWSHRVINGPAPSTLSRPRPSRRSYQLGRAPRSPPSKPHFTLSKIHLEFSNRLSSISHVSTTIFFFAMWKKYLDRIFPISMIDLIRLRVFNSTKIQANFDDFEISFFYSVLSRGITGLYARPRITIWRLLLFLLLLLAVSLRYPGVPYYIGNVRAESRSPVGGCAGDVGDGGQRRRGRKEMAPGGVIEAT